MGPRIGTAGWQVPHAVAQRFPAEGSVLERYAAVFNAVEVNSSFYRPHRPSTWSRWAASVPNDFRFAVKAPRTVTHERRLVDCDEPLERFLGEIAALGPKLGPILVQLPPSLAFDGVAAARFFELLRARFDGELVFEPRHPTWFAAAPERLLIDHRIARVAADPACVPDAAAPGGWPGLRYWRLHGSPRIYWSSYPPDALSGLAAAVARSDNAWVIFDNTGAGAAAENALALMSA